MKNQTNFFLNLILLLVGNEMKPQRRGSVGSLDSGMSISYTSASTGSRDTNKARLIHQQQQQQQSQNNQSLLNAMNSGISPLLLASGGIGNTVAAASGPVGANLAQPGFLGGIFNRRERKLSKSDEIVIGIANNLPTTGPPSDRSTEV